MRRGSVFAFFHFLLGFGKRVAVPGPPRTDITLQDAVIRANRIDRGAVRSTDAVRSSPHPPSRPPSVALVSNQAVRGDNEMENGCILRTPRETLI